MKKLFYTGIAGLILFEIANVYFIMPMPLPGSQRMESLPFAYFIYHGRWVFRCFFGLLIVLGLLPAYRASRWIALAALAAAGAVVYMFNFEMAADKMFYQPRTLSFADAQHNAVEPEKLVLGIEVNGQAKAYPIQFLGFHHQVRDTVGGKPVMVTYCTVCRTGRVFEPLVNGKEENFRLVGMDHFNAMFEDATTGSWWRQVTGEAVAGPLKGRQLPELPLTQTALKTWLAMYPASLVMQPDTVFNKAYEHMKNYELGIKRGGLTGTDSLSWKDKSWVVGIVSGPATKAYDWNRLKQERIIHDTLVGRSIVLVLADDDKSFFAFERAPEQDFELRNDTLFSEERAWDLRGVATNPAAGSRLKKINAYQEFWHSWRTFHPDTRRDTL